MVKPEKHHRTTVILNGEKVGIDTKILPLVVLINSMLGFATRYSCAGDVKITGERHLPYVSFLCDDGKEETIERFIREFVTNRDIPDDDCISFSMQSDIRSRNRFSREDCRRMHIGFPSRSVMLDFTQWLEQTLKERHSHVGHQGKLVPQEHPVQDPSLQTL